jgi:hypothetical protein
MLMPLMRRPIPAGGVDAISPYGYPGPLISPGTSAAQRRIFGAAIDALRATDLVALFVRCHPLMPLPAGSIDGLGGLVEHGPTVSIDLTLPEAEQWRQIKQRHRSDLGRAARLGHVVRFSEDAADLARFVDLYHATMRRLGVGSYYFFADAYFHEMRAALGGHLHLALVEIGGELACAGLFGEASGIIQYHLSGVADGFVGASPAKTMLDHVRRWAAARGNQVFHLGGGAGAESDSLMLFKAGFSDVRHAFRTWRVVLDESAYRRLSGDDGRTDGFFPAYRRPA